MWPGNRSLPGFLWPVNREGGLQASGGLRVTGSGLRTSGYGLRAADLRFAMRLSYVVLTHWEFAAGAERNVSQA